jgi:hypothetical protein
MENLTIQELWKQNEAFLESTRKLNRSLLKEVKTEQAKSSLKGLLFLPVSTLIFYISTASYGLYFTSIHLETWYFAFSGLVVTLFSILFVVSSIKQLKQILSVDYNAPVLNLQKDISKIKTSVIHNLRIAAWLLPFAPFVGILFIKAVFNFDLAAQINYNIIYTFGGITIVLEILSILVLRALRQKNINRKWVNWLLQKSGSQVDEALGFLEQIDDFENSQAVK